MSYHFLSIAHPVRIQFTNGNLTEYVYAADGRKLREKHTTAVEGLTVYPGSKLVLTPAQTMSADSMDYAGNLRFKRQFFYTFYSAFHLDYHFDGGYMSVRPSYGATPPGQAPVYYANSHYFIRDHQGNNRLVVDGSDNIEQTNNYFPYGGPWGDSTDQGFQPFKYNGKELDRMHGLDWYDYGARRYDPAYCLFTQMDPLAEQYPHLNPYVYCAGNPVRYVDPDGKKPKPYEAALMAAYVYGDGNSKSYARSLAKEGWIVSSFNTSISNESKNGLQGKLFEKTKDGVTEYAYAYAGTDINSIADIIADITQVAGLSSQYKMAIDNAKTLSTEIGDNELTFVGHSLGGGEAAAASMATGRAAITFNPAAVSNSTRLYNLLGSSRQIENYRSVWWKSGMLKLGFGGDPLNILQDRFKMKAPGRTHLVPIGLKKPLASHSIESIIDKLWEME